MFGLGKRKTVPAYDETGKAPAICSGICTGEQTAGSKDLATCHFEEVMLQRTEADLRMFLRTCGLEESEILREW